MSKVKKIIIIGCAGSGKTTLSKAMGQRFMIPLYHLDYYYWKPGWVESEAELFKKTHQMLIDQPAWIIDGNQMNTLSERMAATEMVIFLDMPTIICLWRIILRWLRNWFRNVKDGQATLTWGLLCYAWRYNRVYRPVILDLIKRYRHDPNKVIFMLRSSRKLRKTFEKIASFVE